MRLSFLPRLRQTIDELIHDQLGGQYADQGHVVLEADCLSSTDFIDQLLDRSRLEYAALADFFRSQQLSRVTRFRTIEEALRFRCPVRLLGPLVDRGRNQTLGAALQ